MLGMSRLLSVAAGRRSKFLVLGAWIVLVVGLGPFAGRFEQVQRNEPSSFLPEGAESVEVLEAAAAFPSGEVTPAVAVFGSSDGLGRGSVESARRRVEAAGLQGVEKIAPVVYSRDGTGALFAVPIRAEGDEEVLIDAVESVRELVRQDLPEGVDVAVTGPAGFSADASKAFEGINTTLLLATVGLVFVLLVLIYRSPIFWALPLVSVLFAESVVRGLGYLLAEAGAVINGQTGGILLVLVFGAGTDYALLLTARYREELQRVEDKHEAMAIALRQAGPAIVASAGTVVAALLCLSLAEVNSVSGLGPVGAMGVAVAAAAMLTLLPALLLIGGRRAFWPFVPRYGSAGGDSGPRRWERVGRAVERRHRRVWLASAAGLAVLALGTFTLDDNLTTASFFRGSVAAVQGQRLLEQSFPAGASAPAVVLVRDESKTEAALEAARNAPGVASVGRVERGEGESRFDVTLTTDPYGEQAFSAVEPLRERLRAAAGPGVLVGGPTAEEADLRASTDRDTRLLVPLVLLVVSAILVLLLRSLVAPAMLMATVVLSFLAAIGGSLLLFEAFADFPGEDPSYLLISFIFLVALGVDYNIFLMARVREEATRHPTRDAMLTGLAATGGVITSAGIVLAGTFSVLAVLPLVALTQIGITVAFGVLLDTFVVRSLLVPALTWELDERTWWPRSPRGRTHADPGAERLSADPVEQRRRGGVAATTRARWGE
jgi:RND superfamily putative drug exporter